MRLKMLAGLVVALLCIALPSPAAVYYHIHEPLQNTYGSAMPGVTYYVYTAGTTDTAAIYSDRAGTRLYQGDANLATDAGGMFDFYVTAGCYDLPFEDSTRWGDIADTLWNRCEGIADSVGAGPVNATTLTVTGESSFGDAAGDTVKVRGHIWTKGSDMFRDWAGDAMWGYEMSGTRRLGSDADRVWGIGASFELEEDIPFTRALAATDTIDGTGDYDTYLDRPILSMREQSGKAFTYQTLDITNTRGLADKWKWGGYVGELGGDYGAPSTDIRLIGDLPDSNGTLGYRTLLDVIWSVPADANSPRNQIANTQSRLMALSEDGASDVSHYLFKVSGLVMSPDVDTNQKKLQILSGPSHRYTELTNTSTTATKLIANNGEVDIVHSATGGDSARVDVNRTIIDYLTLVKWTGALPVVARAQEFGDGTAFWRGADAEPATAQTLFIYSDGDSLYHYWESDGTVSP